MRCDTARTRRVLLADDHELVRAGLHAQLQRLGQFETVHAWSRASLLRAAAIPPGCDLALVDLHMPGMNGAEGIAALCAAHPALPVIVVTGVGSDEMLAQARAWSDCPNVRGVLHKTGQVGALRELIDLALACTTPVAPTQLPPSVLIHPADHEKLTPRQQEVALAAAAGMTNHQIGHALHLSEGTVKNHMKTVFRVLGVSNRTQLALRMRAPGSHGE